MDRPEPASAAAQERERFVQAVRALRRYRARVARRLERLQADLAEAEGAPQFRRFGETLLTYMKQVPARAERVMHDHLMVQLALKYQEMQEDYDASLIYKKILEADPSAGEFLQARVIAC